MKPRSWLVASLVGLLVVLVLGAFPVRAYLDQGQQRKELTARVAAVTAANDALAQKAAELKDPSRVEALARERYQLVRPGEEAYSILPTGEPPGPGPASAPAALLKPHPGWLSRAWSKLTSLF